MISLFSGRALVRETPGVALIRVCGFEHFLGFLLDSAFVEQKHILQRSACHQHSWDGTSQPSHDDCGVPNHGKRGKKWHFSLKFSGYEESQTPHGITC